MPPYGVGMKGPVCFVVGSRRLIIQSRFDPPPRIQHISAPSQSRPLLGQAPCRPALANSPGNFSALYPPFYNTHAGGRHVN